MLTHAHTFQSTPPPRPTIRHSKQSTCASALRALLTIVETHALAWFSENYAVRAARSLSYARRNNRHLLIRVCIAYYTYFSLRTHKSVKPTRAPFVNVWRWDVSFKACNVRKNQNACARARIIKCALRTARSDSHSWSGWVNAQRAFWGGAVWGGHDWRGFVRSGWCREREIYDLCTASMHHY